MCCLHMIYAKMQQQNEVFAMVTTAFFCTFFRGVEVLSGSFPTLIRNNFFENSRLLAVKSCAYGISKFCWLQRSRIIFLVFSKRTDVGPILYLGRDQYLLRCAQMRLPLRAWKRERISSGFHYGLSWQLSFICWFASLRQELSDMSC